MDLEFHQLDLRYEALRKRSPRREARLLASLADAGQQVPVIVVAGDDGRQVLVDGYKRVRALVRLRRDTVRAVAWDLAEAEALLLERLMRSALRDRQTRDRIQVYIPLRSQSIIGARWEEFDRAALDGGVRAQSSWEGGSSGGSSHRTTSGPAAASP